MYLKQISIIAVLLIGLTGHNQVIANDKKFVDYSQTNIAITNVKVIDGTGSPSRNNQTLLISNGKVAALGASQAVQLPKDTVIIDGSDKTVIPGLVMMHEHMFYPTGNRNYTEMLYSFPRLYLAGGATSIRTAGTTAPYADLNLRDAINAGRSMGPEIDVTAPYLNGPGLPILKIKPLRDVDNAKKMMDYWISEGVTSYKAYMHIRHNELEQVIKLAQHGGHKVTAHLCSITYREAAELGIDNLEHGFFAATDFVKGKKKDQCPAKGNHQSLVDLNIESKEVEQLITLLVNKNVALTSTLTVFETFTTGRPKAYPKALEALIPQVRKQYEDQWQKISELENPTWPIVFKKMMQLEKKFVDAGGTLMVGTDPTGYGGVIAGFSNQRAIELLIETGFSIEQAIKIATLNAATYLGEETRIGSIEPGKQADLVLLDGDLTTDVSNIQSMSIVFKNGIGYNSQKLFKATQSVVGLH